MLSSSRKKREQGFSMLEMIIVVFLVSFALVSIYSAFSVLVVLNSDSIDRLKATYLAQEGLEIVRNIRDDNWNNDQLWLSGLDACTAGCQVDYKSNGVDKLPTAWGNDGNYLATDSGFYGYLADALKNSKFKRKITIASIDGHSSKVTAEVFFSSKPFLNLPNSQEVKIETVLYDWK